MKNISTFFISFLIIGFSFISLSYRTADKEIKSVLKSSNVIEISAEVQSILDSKCIACHSTESDSQKSKMKLNFDKFTNGKYSNGKIVSKLGKIKKQVEKGKMPTEKYLKKNPDKKLTVDESKLLIKWSTEQRAILAGE